MKLIEAMKLVKELKRKSDDLVQKITVHCAQLNVETPLYPDQKAQVAEWLQAHGDIQKEIEQLRCAVQKTNLATPVSIELGGKTVNKSIAAWIHRRRELAGEQNKAWGALTDRNLREGLMKNSQEQVVEVKIVRHYEPRERDEMVAMFREEPSVIDRTLEVVNAVTDLVP